jgi:hypothetical protein
VNYGRAAASIPRDTPQKIATGIKELPDGVIEG